MAFDRFNRAYFDRWYRHPRHRVKSPAELRRQVRVAVSAAEWVLGRALRSVLDVGSGEGNWRAPLRELRPRLSYLGVDPSEYVVERFGAKRNIRLGGFSDVDSVVDDTHFDLVVCCGVVQFLSPAEFARGLPALAKRTGGLLHLEIFAAEDDIVGDQHGERRSATWYRRQLSNAGLVGCGLHNYVPARAADDLAELERLPMGRA